MASSSGGDFKRKFMDGADEHEMRLKRQQIFDHGSHFESPSGSTAMYRNPYVYKGQPPPFPVIRVRGLPFECVKSDILDFFYGLQILDILFVHKGVRFTGEAFCVLAYPLQVDFAIQRNMRNMGRRYIEVFKSTRQEYYSAVANEVLETTRSGSRAKSNDESWRHMESGS
ncbi:uncharacterized protein A4U43_C07F37300 [Asparagus officinalis]|uniref:RRM domain-containing protein n=2 Tax=Asparagus officinalis TaxID=4686 RepID=A0A5P1EHV3_ASPOF|nr:uncharacterized protein A4U43_C07F37300 [Asparagus officinalis]